MRRDRQNDQNGALAAVLAQTPSSTEDAFAVLPQNLTAAILIAFASKRGKRKAADGERTAIAHSQGRADHSWRNRHFAYAAEEAELGSLELQKFCTRVIANFASPVSLTPQPGGRRACHFRFTPDLRPIGKRTDRELLSSSPRLRQP